MRIDDYARWLGRATLAVAIIMIGWGASVVLRQPVTAWFAASATIWMALLLISAFWQLRGSFTGIAALALATAVVSRLFSILPDGGYEFGVFWAAMIAVFAVLGGGRYSVDRELWRSEPARRLLPGIMRKVLAS